MRRSTGFGLFLLVLAGFVAASFLLDSRPAPEAPVFDRSSTGGAPTLEEILARQSGLIVAPPDREIESAEGAAAMIGSQLGTRGAASDSDLWQALRTGQGANIDATTRDSVGTVVMQNGGMRWLAFREGPLRQYGGGLLLGTIAALALFYLLRGRIMVEHGLSGVRILRFAAIERFAHWLMAGSFVLLALTGLYTLFGRLMIPWFGHETVSTLAIGAKWVHNNVSWAFMLGLALAFLFWVVHNLPDRTDLRWLREGGGIFSAHKHPPAKKFNAGQKVIFWSTMLFGVSISLSGLSLLFPFELALFAPTFAVLNDLGIPGLLGMDPLPTVLAPQEEMQLSQLWHAIIGFAFMAMILAHIYIGSVGMQGAHHAMTDGQVDINWAKEHHSLWVEEVAAKRGLPKGTQPAE